MLTAARSPCLCRRSRFAARDAARASRALRRLRTASGAPDWTSALDLWGGRDGLRQRQKSEEEELMEAMDLDDWWFPAPDDDNDFDPPPPPPPPPAGHAIAV